ncbi:hypothetical protein B0H13DRAFT_2291813 [Mycena leptocephala]|nr:hypothetical protein B0H13DRAFT_2291813 [Mycena leptocephala]
MHGTQEEAAYAAKEIRAPFNVPSNAPSSEVDTAVPSDSEDVYMRLDRLQRSNAVFSAERTVRPARVPINTPRPQAPSTALATAAAGPSQVILPRGTEITTRQMSGCIWFLGIPSIPSSHLHQRAFCSVLTRDAGLVNPIDTATAGTWFNQVPDLSRLSVLTHG